MASEEDEVVLRFACCSFVVDDDDELPEGAEVALEAVSFAVSLITAGSLSSTEDDIVVNPSSAFPFAFEMVTIALFASALPLLIMLMFTLFSCAGVRY